MPNFGRRRFGSAQIIRNVGTLPLAWDEWSTSLSISIATPTKNGSFSADAYLVYKKTVFVRGAATPNSWTNPQNATNNDGVFSTAAPANNATVAGLWDFASLNIPDGSTILGISVSAGALQSGSVCTFRLSYYKSGNALGTETSWNPTASETVYTKVDDTSGAISLADLNTAGAVQIYASAVRSGNPGSTVSLDYISMTVDYLPSSYSVVTGSFTSNAYIAWNFKTNAVIVRNLSSSFTANAAVKSNKSSSFPADSWITKTTSYTFSANADVYKNQSSTFFVSASVRKTFSSSFSGDAAVRRTTSGSFFADSALRRIASFSVAADAVLRAVATGTFAIDAALVAKTSATFTSDAYIYSAAAGLFSIDAVVLRAAAYGWPVNAVLVSNRVRSFYSSAVVLRTATSSFVGSATMLRQRTSTFVAAAITLRSASSSFASNAALLRRSASSFSVAAAIERPTTGSITVDSTFYRRTTGSFVAAAFVKTFFKIDAWISSKTTSSFSTNAIKLSNASGSFIANSLAKKTIFGTLGYDAVLRVTQNGSFYASATKLKTGNAASATVDALKLQTRTGGFYASAAVLSSNIGSFVQDACLQTNFDSSFNIEASISPVLLTTKIAATSYARTVIGMTSAGTIGSSSSAKTISASQQEGG